MQGRTVGLWGFGRIAKEVAKKFEIFGVHLIAYDKYADETVFKEYGVESVSFDELMERSNILSLHVALTEETEGIINYEAMKKLPTDAIIINTCRGAIINEVDLIQIIKEGHLAGVGLDVLVEEPPNPELE